MGRGGGEQPVKLKKRGGSWTEMGDETGDWLGTARGGEGIDLLVVET